VQGHIAELELFKTHGACGKGFAGGDKGDLKKNIATNGQTGPG
jgi:hypothetical protein